MSGKRSRDKGSREELAIVNLHKDHGIFAERTLENGKRPNGDMAWDIDLYVYGVDEAPLIGECKVKGQGFKKIYDYLGDADFLTIRADRKPRIYCMTEEVWLRLMMELKR